MVVFFVSILARILLHYIGNKSEKLITSKYFDIYVKKYWVYGLKFNVSFLICFRRGTELSKNTLMKSITKVYYFDGASIINGPGAAAKKGIVSVALIACK